MKCFILKCVCVCARARACVCVCAQVNGFFQARGIAGYIPVAYIYIARQFFEEVQRFDQSQRIQLFEYFRENWTFHAKGLWYYLPQKTLPSLTLVGSPNFGKRGMCVGVCRCVCVCMCVCVEVCMHACVCVCVCVSEL